MEKRYLKNWDYNCARLLDCLKTIIENNGGKVKEFPKYEIVNRSVSDVIEDCKEKISLYENYIEKNGNNDRLNNALIEYKNKLEKAINFDNKPLELPIYHQIVFVLDNMYYSYVLDDNPFFDFILWKTPVIENNQYNVCLGEIVENKEWLFDSFFRFDCTTNDIKESANMLFNILVKFPSCKLYKEKEKKCVPNYYNNGYHYEIIEKPVQKRKIDF